MAPHGTNSMLFPDGSRIGYRGIKADIEKDPNFNTPAFSKNHYSLNQIRDLIGKDKFESAYKISSIRNPYDRCISAFHFQNRTEEAKGIDNFVLLKKTGKIDQIKKSFASFMLGNKYSGMMHFYCGSTMVIDKFIKMEEIPGGLSDVFAKLNVARDLSEYIIANIPKFKKTSRAKIGLKISDYYTPETINVVNSLYSNWFVWGNYEICQSLTDLDNAFL